jgi:hypothetical protein
MSRSMPSRRAVLLVLSAACVPDVLAAQSWGGGRSGSGDRPGITGSSRRSDDRGSRRDRRSNAGPSEPEDFPLPSGRGQGDWPRPQTATPPRNPGQAWDTERRARPSTAAPPANPNIPGEDTERQRRVVQSRREREERLARREQEIEEGVRRYREEAERDFDERRREQRDRRRSSRQASGTGSFFR